MELINPYDVKLCRNYYDFKHIHGVQKFLGHSSFLYFALRSKTW